VHNIPHQQRMRYPLPLEPQEKEDPREEAARHFGISSLPSTVAFKRVATGTKWRTLRKRLLPVPTTTRSLDRQQDLIMQWVEHYDQSFLDLEDSLFQDNYLIERHVLEQWRLAYNNTFYAINDAVFVNAFSDDITHFPYHLGVAWHLAKEPLEIFAIAKKLVDLCDLLAPEGGKLKLRGDTLTERFPSVWKKSNSRLGLIHMLQNWT